MSIIKYHTNSMNQLIVRCSGNDDELREMYELLTDMRLCLVNPVGYAMQYNSEKFRNTPSYKLLSSKEDALKNIIPLSHVPEDILTDFMNESESNTFFLSKGRIDRRASTVFLDGRTILGIMYICRFEGNNYVGSACYLHPSAKYDIIVPLLIVAAIRNSVIAKETGESLLICPTYEAGHTGFLKVFGKPDDEIHFQDYSLMFRERSEIEDIIQKIEKYNEEHDYRTGNAYLDEFLEGDASCWFSENSIKRVPYVADIRKMPIPLLKPYKADVFEWLKKVGLDAEENWKKLVFRCGRDKSFAGSMNVYEYHTEECRKIFTTYRETGELPPIQKQKCKLDEIRLFVFEDESQELLDIIPEHLRKRIEEQDCLVVGAMTPDNEVIGISVASHLLEGLNIGFHEYQYVIGDYAGIGLQEKMLEAELYIMVESGCDALYIRSQLDNQKFDIEKFFEGRASLAMKKNNYISAYTIDEFTGNDIYQRYISRINFGDVVSYISDREDPRLLEFSKKCWNDGCYINPAEFDIEYNPFIVENGKITASIFALQVSDHELVIRDGYTSGECSLDNPPGIMVASVLKKAAAEMADDSIVVFKLRRKEELEALQKMLGSEGIALNDSEYFYWLNTYDFESDLSASDFNMPEKISITQGVAEKIRVNNLIYAKNQKFDVLTAVMLEITSRVPCREIVKYIKDYYMKK